MPKCRANFFRRAAPPERKIEWLRPPAFITPPYTIKRGTTQSKETQPGEQSYRHSNRYNGL